MTNASPTRPDPLAVARRLAVIPLSLIPLRPADKRPDGSVLPGGEWKPYQDHVSIGEDHARWFGTPKGRERNVGIVTGQVSGIIAIDTDSPEAEAWAVEHLPKTPMMTKTAKGFHRFYRHPGGEIGNQVKVNTTDGRLSLDVKGDGGYVVAPGSRHASGCLYTATDKWPQTVDELPVFDPRTLERPRQQPVPAPVMREHAEARGSVIRRARAYLVAIPGAIEGQGGDTLTLSVACHLVRGFALAPAEALPLFLEWNTRCQPP